MPQMAPISWLILFILFFFMFILFNIMNYYCYFNLLPSHQKQNMKYLSMNWKW